MPDNSNQDALSRLDDLILNRALSGHDQECIETIRRCLTANRVPMQSEDLLNAFDRICEHVGAPQYAASHRDMMDMKAIRAALLSSPGDDGYTLPKLPEDYRYHSIMQTSEGWGVLIYGCGIDKSIYHGEGPTPERAAFEAWSQKPDEKITAGGVG